MDTLRESDPSFLRLLGISHLVLAVGFLNGPHPNVAAVVPFMAGMVCFKVSLRPTRQARAYAGAASVVAFAFEAVASVYSWHTGHSPLELSLAFMWIGLAVTVFHVFRHRG